jgi:predicted HTH transcriptional regulator
MEAQELLTLIRKGESSTVQFKERSPHGDSLAQELIAFSNSRGGLILFGIDDKTGALHGLSFAEIQHLNQQLVNTASQKVYPPVYLTTETVLIQDQCIVVVLIPEGAGKPYKDVHGTIYVKNGADKRKVTSNNELARLLQDGGNFYADELPIQGSSVKDINIDKFRIFVTKNTNYL